VTDTLKDAKEAVFQALNNDKGIQCPCCEQYARVWRRVLGSTIAGPLVDIYRAAHKARLDYAAADASAWSGSDVCTCGHRREEHRHKSGPLTWTACAKPCRCRSFSLATGEPQLDQNAAIDVVIGYVDVRQFRYRGGDYSKGTHWGLLQAHPSRANIFHLTELGVAFVEGRATVPRYSLIYNDGVVGFSEERTDISTSLGTEFSLDALKAGG
jgi:hypothetical protein